MGWLRERFGHSRDRLGERKRERERVWGIPRERLGRLREKKILRSSRKRLGRLREGLLRGREGEREREKEGERERSSYPVIGSTAIALGLDIFPAISVVRLLPSTLATSI